MVDNMFTIYMIENKINHKIYVGKTSKDPEERFRQHKNASYRDSNFHLHNSIRKYGEQNFDLMSLEETSTEERANELEKKWINRFQTFNKVGYNMIEGGKGLGAGENHPQYGNSLSEEHKNDLSKSLTGREYSDETLEKMSKSSRGKRNGFYGKTHSEDAKRKMSKNHKGSPTEETKKKISKSVSGENNGFYGKSHSEETKEKISKTKRGNGNKINEDEAREIKWLALNTNQKQSKIGEKYNIAGSTVSRIKNEYDCKHIDPKKPKS